MNTFPLVRTRWSNEHIMAAVFLVTVLYLLPQWIKRPSGILGFAAVTVLSLLLDAAVNMIRYKQPTCAVSAGVTAAILYTLTPGAPLWGQLLGTAAALVVGKHLWGGTGKNGINPAITGVLLISLLFPVTFPTFTPSVLLVPAVVLSLPFIRFRPFAAIGFMAGMAAPMLLSGELTVTNALSYGVAFWGCLVVTDPVSTSRSPLIGAAAGLLGGFLPLYLDRSVAALALGVLVVNVVSYATDRVGHKPLAVMKPRFRIKRAVPFVKNHILMRDLAVGEHAPQSETQGAAGQRVSNRDKAGGDNSVTGGDNSDTKEKILEQIQEKEVFGLGGAAFPTYKKIQTVMNAKASRKHFIVNAVECDPGLIHDQWLLRSHPDEICKGIELVKRCVGFDSVTLAVKDPEGLVFPKNLKIAKVSDLYPVGAERILIREALGKRISEDAIPASEGVLVLNVQTVYSIFEAVCLDRKADTRFITVADLRSGSGQVVRVRLGMKIHEVLERIFPASGYVFSGGGLMQARVAPEDAVIDSSVNFIATGEYPRYKESHLCSRCGRCIRHCPAGIRVNLAAELVDRGEPGQAAGYHAGRCIQCGSCSVVCPGGRNLSARMKTVKNQL